MTDKEKLFSEFPEISKDEWLAKVEKDLKGKSAETLQWTIEKGIVLDPFYHPQDVETNKSPLVATKTNDWEIGEDIIVDNLKNANTELLNALQNGVNAPRLVINDSLNSDEMEILLQDVNLGFISTHFKTKGFAYPIVEALTVLLLKKGQSDTQISGSINDDALSTENALTLLPFIKKNLPKFKYLAIEIPDEGLEKTTDSLANAVLKGNNYLSSLSESGLNLEDINRQLYFSITVGNSYFVEIARIRALKILWLNVLTAYGIENPKAPCIEAHLSTKAFETDPNTNMIKSTTQAMSAVMGGINRLTVLPSDTLNESSSSSAKRIARNVQHILKMESFFDRVADPAAGSYFVEKLTEELAESAWKKFQGMVRI